MKKYSAFTLLELLITIAIVGIVTAIAAPAMQTFIKNDRLVTQINSLVGHLSLARSEAVVRNQQVVVCVSNNSTTCAGSDWSEGWIVFVDTDNDSAFTAGEPIVRAQQALEGGNTMNSSIGTSVVYDNRGFAAAGSTGTFSLCDDRLEDHIKAISISNTGRVRKGGSTSCS
jgi:type IV fimbrial biogenesis protein FimT